MDDVREVAAETPAAPVPCVHCRATGSTWDRVAGLPFCPDCQERLAHGETEALRLRAAPRPCAVCRHPGSVPFRTHPLRAAAPVEFDLCAVHFRALFRRGLDHAAFHHLVRKLRRVGVTPGQVFLLHEAFYDRHGRALQPVPDVA